MIPRGLGLPPQSRHIRRAHPPTHDEADPLPKLLLQPRHAPRSRNRIPLPTTRQNRRKPTPNQPPHCLALIPDPIKRPVERTRQRARQLRELAVARLVDGAPRIEDAEDEPRGVRLEGLQVGLHLGEFLRGVDEVAGPGADHDVDGYGGGGGGLADGGQGGEGGREAAGGVGGAELDAVGAGGEGGCGGGGGEAGDFEHGGWRGVAERVIGWWGEGAGLS